MDGLEAVKARVLEGLAEVLNRVPASAEDLRKLLRDKLFEVLIGKRPPSRRGQPPSSGFVLLYG